MDLVTPQIGLLFWTVLIFLVLVFLLAKFAWKPILKMVEERTKNIARMSQQECPLLRHPF